MLHKFDEYLSKPVFRLGAWALLLVLTLFIFLIPGHLTDQSYPVESLYVFSNLLLFGCLFFVWFVVLIALAVSYSNDRTRNVENMILVAIFTLVFSGIWVSLRGSYAGEASRDASNIAYLNLYGHISLTNNIYRGQFPGAAIFGSAASQITGLRDWDVLTVLLILQIILFPIFLYLLVKNVINDSRWAILGVLLAITGSIMVDKQLYIFHPAGFAVFFLFAPCLLLLTRQLSRSFINVPSILLCIIFIAALTVTHFVTSSVLFLVLVGICVLQLFKGKKLAIVSLVGLCFTIVLGWEMYQAISNLGGIAALIPEIINDFRHGLYISGYATSLAGSYTSGANPLWANLTRYFWLGLLFAFAAVLGIRNLIRVKKLSETEIVVTGGLLAIGMMLAITLLGSGANEIERVLLYAPFFTVTLIIIFFHELRGSLEKYSFAALAIVLVLLIFPTFLAHNNVVGSSAYYSFEFNGYAWLKEQYSNEFAFYSAGGGAPSNYYFEAPLGHDINVSLEYVSEQNANGLLAERLNNIDVLEEMSQWYNSIYIFEYEKETLQFEHLLDYNPVNSPEWQELLQQLDKQNRIYDNGYMQFYRFGNG